MVITPIPPINTKKFKPLPGITADMTMASPGLFRLKLSMFSILFQIVGWLLLSNDRLL